KVAIRKPSAARAGWTRAAQSSPNPVISANWFFDRKAMISPYAPPSGRPLTRKAIVPVCAPTLRRLFEQFANAVHDHLFGCQRGLGDRDLIAAFAIGLLVADIAKAFGIGRHGDEI